MTEFESLSLIIAFGQMLTGMVAVGSVLLGIRQMRRAGDQREKREDARHREAMEVLRQQGEAFREQNKTLREESQALREQGQALRGLVKGMETVIERTAPKEQPPASPGGETP